MGVIRSPSMDINPSATSFSSVLVRFFIPAPIDFRSSRISVLVHGSDLAVLLRIACHTIM